MFPAFRSRAYRRFWTGAFVSNTGTWMHQTAFGWLVYTLTSSTFWLGATAFVAMSPSLLLSLYGGVIADRTDCRRLLIATQTILMITALVLAALARAEVITLGHILALSLLSGIALAFSTPAYQTVLHELVPPEHLMNAISLNSVQFNLARILGPLGMGLLTPLIGIAGCFVINGLTFLAIIAAVATLDVTVRGGAGTQSIRSELLSGIRYAWRTPTIRTPLVLAATLSLFGIPYIILLPAFARDVLHLHAERYGYLVASPGAGAVIGGLGLAALGNIHRKGLLAAVGALAFSTNLIAFAFSTRPAVAAFFLFLAGMSMVSAVATINTLLQVATDPRARGRVMSMLAFALFGLTPIGSLHLGAWARLAGTPWALAGGGAACLVVAAYLLLFAEELRRPVQEPVGEAA